MNEKNNITIENEEKKELAKAFLPLSLYRKENLNFSSTIADLTEAEKKETDLKITEFIQNGTLDKNIIKGFSMYINSMQKSLKDLINSFLIPKAIFKNDTKQIKKFITEISKIQIKETDFKELLIKINKNVYSTTIFSKLKNMEQLDNLGTNCFFADIFTQKMKEIQRKLLITYCKNKTKEDFESNLQYMQSTLTELQTKTDNLFKSMEQTEMTFLKIAELIADTKKEQEFLIKSFEADTQKKELETFKPKYPKFKITFIDSLTTILPKLKNEEKPEIISNPLGNNRPLKVICKNR